MGSLFRKQGDKNLQLGNGLAVELAERLGNTAVFGSDETGLLHSLREAIFL